MSKKHKDLQPWLDYFEMLKTYVDKGFLEVFADKHEAYITRAAWLTLSDSGSPELAAQGIFGYIRYKAAASEGLKDYDAAMHVNLEGPASDKPVWQTLEIQKRADAITKRLKGMSFAIHVVAEEYPHDLFCTILLSRCRVWWKLFAKTERIEVITY